MSYNNIQKIAQQPNTSAVNVLNYIPPEYHAGIKNGTNSVDLSSYIQSALDLGGTIEFPDGTYKVTGLSISNQSDIKISGNATITSAADDRIFDLIGTINNIEIAGLTLVGANNGIYSQAGIGCSSGQTITNARFNNLTIKQTNIGISLNADLSGTIQQAIISNNHIENIVGTASGKGYGIHTANGESVTIANNVIINCSRHSIYQAKGTNTGNVITGNVIRDHRLTDNDDTQTVAIKCARSSGVVISNNTLIDCYDGGMSVNHDESGGFNIDDIIVIGNAFINRMNVVSHLYVGQEVVPVSYRTSGVLISGNYFDSDNTVSTGGTLLYVVNGNNINISNNHFKLTNTAAADQCIKIGNDTYLDDANSCDDIIIKNNHFDADVSGGRAVAIASEISGTYTSNQILVKDNTFKNITTEIYESVTRTNKGIFTHNSFGVAQGIYTDADTTPTVKGVNWLHIANTGVTSITDFDDAVEGQRVIVTLGNANTTFKDVSTTGSFNLAGSTDSSGLGGGDILEFIYRSGAWYEITRSNN